MRATSFFPIFWGAFNGTCESAVMKTKTGAALAAAFTLGSSMLYPMPSLAVCYRGHPAPKVEFGESRMVVLGRAVSSQAVMSEEDPDIVGKTIY